MAELHNPLFEDEKEFLERQKLEYERALLGDVDQIKEKTQEIGKYAAIGAGVLGGIWLIAKAFGGKKDSDDDDEEEGYEEFEDDRLARRAQKKREKQERKKNKNSHRAAYVHNPAVHDANEPAGVGDDYGFGGGQQFDRGQQYQAYGRADIAPDVYHASAETDPFPPLPYDDARRLPVSAFNNANQASNGQPSVVASVFQNFMQSDTGKMLLAQVTAVLMAYVAKKVGEYLPVDKNSDLADIPTITHMEPETKDIDFSYHHDDADAPQQSL